MRSRRSRCKPNEEKMRAVAMAKKLVQMNTLYFWRDVADDFEYEAPY